MDASVAFRLDDFRHGDSQAVVDHDDFAARHQPVASFQVIQPEPPLMARMVGATPRMLRLKPVIEALHA